MKIFDKGKEKYYFKNILKKGGGKMETRNSRRRTNNELLTMFNAISGNIELVNHYADILEKILDEIKENHLDHSHVLDMFNNLHLLKMEIYAELKALLPQTDLREVFFSNCLQGSSLEFTIIKNHGRSEKLDLIDGYFKPSHNQIDWYENLSTYYEQLSGMLTIHAPDEEAFLHYGQYLYETIRLLSDLAQEEDKSLSFHFAYPIME